ncbi:hypothetical protein bmyco0002_53320 [Bacillus pseudomycoides]|uniref:hypothetical protein n=1 Tax=Bacillus pseudomycoides TaxID=64104 RepID=UPI0001A14C69|nr:hypothetical protein [Bacillus pseudomycoides]EEM02317.1 hypothetical protein bmyco0002_53320 [Bacillus pseudomycoides]MCR8861186.1 hypothetical protein [Bacillus pseudomycoides]
MSISAPDELQLFAQEIQSFLSPSILRDLAGVSPAFWKKTTLVKKYKKISPVQNGAVRKRKDEKYSSTSY